MPIKKRAHASELSDDGQSRARLSRVSLWLIDLDDTIFNASAGMLEAIHERMESFIAEKLDLAPEAAVRVQKDYWRTYGATFVGLARHHAVPPEEFFRATHDFDLRPYLKTTAGRARLREAIAALPGKKVVLTNGPGCYAHAVLRALGIENLFAGVVSASAMHICGKWRSKPDALLFARTARQFGADVRRTCLVDDGPANLAAAKALGMRTVWCRGNRNDRPAVIAHPWAESVIEHLEDLPRLVVRGPKVLARG